MARILHVSKLYAPWIGGVERAVQDMAEGLRLEHEVRVLVCNHHRRYVRETINHVPVVRARTPKIAFSMPLSLQFPSLLAHYARRADLVHFHSPFPLGDLAGVLDGCEGRPVIVSYHFHVVRQWWAMPFYGPVLRALLRRADRVIVSGARMRDSSRALMEVAEKCRIVPYGVRDEAAAPRESFALPARDFVLFVGRLVPYKGCEVLIRAMPQVDAPLVIVGQGPLRGALERLARELGVASRVHFLGALSTPRIRHCYAESRVFAFPSVINTEAFGIVQLEAMSFGKPVVNTDLPTSVPEVGPHDVTGLTVPPRDATALAGALNAILREPERYERYSRAARARAGELSTARFLDGVRAVYREVLS